jgi:hypothetical protein
MTASALVESSHRLEATRSQGFVPLDFVLRPVVLPPNIQGFKLFLRVLFLFIIFQPPALSAEAVNNRRPTSYRSWSSLDTQREFIAELGEKLGLEKPEDWNRVSLTQINKNGGKTLIERYKTKRKMIEALVAPPEGGWKDEHWPSTKIGISPELASYTVWSDLDDQRSAILELGQALGIKKPENWYKVKIKDVRNFRDSKGRGLEGLIKRHGKLSEMIMALAEPPEGGWDKSRFTVYRNWSSVKTQREFMRELGETLGVEKPEDWYSVTKKSIENNGGKGLIKKYEQNAALLIIALVDPPEGGWRPADFKNTKVLCRTGLKKLGKIDPEP